MKYVATIGFFDGVHLGHQQVIHRLRALAASKGMKTMVVTFGNHPLEVVRPDFVPQLLTNADEKVRRLKACGVDEVVVLNFTREMMQQTAYDFMKDVLRDRLGVGTLLIGYDNRFGRRNPEESFLSYVEYGRQLGIDVQEGPRPEECGLFENAPISSSLIRRLIGEGRVNDALSLMELRGEMGPYAL